MMERKCKNKKCQRILPEGYKYKYCEHCRNRHADNWKQFRNVAAPICVAAIAFITKGKFIPKGKQ